MATATYNPASSSDRFLFTLIMAVFVHGIVINITFAPEDETKPEDNAPPTLEVTLVHARDDKSPEDADYLAQANLEGGGTTQKQVHPTSPASTPAPSTGAGRNMLKTPETSPPSSNPPKAAMVITKQAAPEKIQVEKQKVATPETTLTTTEMLTRSLEEINSLRGEIEQQMQAYSKRPRSTVVGANSKESDYAFYLDSWRRKIEKIGNLNYPEAAKRQNLSGTLMLEVQIRQDGSVHKINLIRSSGHQILDDAAKRIVNLAAPFAPLTDEIKKDTDILKILRTWQFQSNNRLHTH